MKNIADKLKNEIAAKKLSELSDMTIEETVDVVVKVFEKEGLKEMLFLEKITEQLYWVCRKIFDECDIEHEKNTTTLYSGKEKSFQIIFKSGE